jgi:hypothetical protein
MEQMMTEMKAEMKAHQERVEANQEWILAKMNAWLEQVKDYREATEACLEKVKAETDAN